MMNPNSYVVGGSTCCIVTYLRLGGFTHESLVYRGGIKETESHLTMFREV